MKLKELFENTKLNLSIKITNNGIKNGRFEDDYRNIDLTGSFDCGGCTSLTSLEEAPTSITGDFSCHGCTSLTSLEGIGKRYLYKIGEDIYLPDTIKSNILGLLKIKDLKRIVIRSTSFSNTSLLEKAAVIINRHLSSDRNIRKCKLELEDAGLEEYAKL